MSCTYRIGVIFPVHDNIFDFSPQYVLERAVLKLSVGCKYTGDAFRASSFGQMLNLFHELCIISFISYCASTPSHE